MKDQSNLHNNCDGSVINGIRSLKHLRGMSLLHFIFYFILSATALLKQRKRGEDFVVFFGGGNLGMCKDLTHHGLEKGFLVWHTGTVRFGLHLSCFCGLGLLHSLSLDLSLFKSR